MRSVIAVVFGLVCVSAVSRAQQHPSTCIQSLDRGARLLQQEAQTGLAKGEYNAVIAELKPQVSANPTQCQLALMLGRAYLYEKDDRQAEHQFRNVLAADATNRVAKLELARLYGYHSKYEQSNRLYRELLAADPTNEQASIGLARNLVGNHQVKEAGEVVTAGLKEHPNSLRLQEYRDALRRPGRYLPGADHKPPRPADLQTWLYFVTDSAGDTVIENVSRLNFALTRKLDAHLGTNLHYLSSLGTVIQAPDGNTENGGGDTTLSTSTFDGSAHLDYHAAHWLTLAGGGGAIRYGDGFSRALFQGAVTFHPTRSLYVESEYLRLPILPTRLAATFDLSAQGPRESLDWYPKSWQVHGDLSNFQYSDGNRRIAQNVEVLRWFGSRAVRLGAGYTGSHLTFSQNVIHGYFSPTSYQHHSGAGLLQIRAHGSFTGEYRVDVGAESISGLGFRPVYELAAHNVLHLHQIDLHADYTRYQFTQSTGAFRTDVGAIGIKYHF